MLPVSEPLHGDRFEGRQRDGSETADASDLMRRLVTEQLLKFDSTLLFPERVAHPVTYALLLPEADLYKKVTDYTRQEFNRADALDSEATRGGRFALTTTAVVTSLNGLDRAPAGASARPVHGCA